MSSHHPLGRPWGDPDQTCDSCAWSRLRGPGRRVLRCQAAGHTRTAPTTPACDRWEPVPDCLACGACCREAFDVVEISRLDPVRRLHPALVVQQDGYLRIRRAPGNRCGALEPDSYACTIYPDRPRCCREFERTSLNCLIARRRVGLSRSWSEA